MLVTPVNVNQIGTRNFSLKEYVQRLLLKVCVCECVCVCEGVCVCVCVAYRSAEN